MTTMDLIEFVAGPTRLNRALNVIEGTILITAHSVNGGKGGRRYSDNALRQIAKRAEGLPAYLNHVAPDMAFKPRDVKDLVGVHRNVRYFPTEGKIVSDLHVAEHQARLVFGLAETLGGIIGNSLVSRGAVRMEGDTEVVDEIVQLRSADLVSDPATTKGLFEARERWLTQSKDIVRDRDPHELHHRLAVALGLAEARAVLPEDVHRRLAAALQGEVPLALPAGIHQRLVEALSVGGAAVPEGIHERLARALQS